MDDLLEVKLVLVHRKLQLQVQSTLDRAAKLKQFQLEGTSGIYDDVRQF